MLTSTVLLVSYKAPTVSSICGFCYTAGGDPRNVPTAGGLVLKLTGANFGPPNTTVTVRYGSNGLEFVCGQLLNASDAYTTVRCYTSAGVGGAPAPIPPAGYTVNAAPPGDLGAVLVGRTRLYWWPTDGWHCLAAHLSMVQSRAAASQRPTGPAGRPGPGFAGPRPSQP